MWAGLTCDAMPCHAVPCHALPCHAQGALQKIGCQRNGSPDLPRYAMPCHAMPCHAQERVKKIGVSVTFGGLPAPVNPVEASQWRVSIAPELSPDCQTMACHAMSFQAQERFRKLRVSVTVGVPHAPIYPVDASQWFVSNAPKVPPALQSCSAHYHLN